MTTNTTILDRRLTRSQGARDRRSWSFDLTLHSWRLVCHSGFVRGVI